MTPPGKGASSCHAASAARGSSVAYQATMVFMLQLGMCSPRALAGSQQHQQQQQQQLSIFSGLLTFCNSRGLACA